MGKKLTSISGSKRGGVKRAFWTYDFDIKWHIQLPMPKLSLILGIESAVEDLFYPESILNNPG